MPHTRAQKDKMIAVATESVDKASVIVMTGFRGIDVATDTELRAKIRETGAQYQVLKNTLARRVLAGDEYEGLREQMTGETAYVFGGDDPVAAVKAVTDFVKDHQEMLAIKGSYFEGRVLTSEQLEELANIPSQEVLLTRLATALKSPIQKIANVLQAPINKFAGTLQALADKKGSDG